MSIVQSRLAGFPSGAKTVAFALMLMLAVGVSPTKADFCEDFELVVATAEEGFAEVRGDLILSHIDPISDMRVVWQCLKGLPGADRCEIEWLRQTYTYQVLWLGPNLEAQAEAFAAVRELLAGCGATEKQISKSGQSIWLVLDGQEDMDIILAYNSNRVRLSFSVIGFPNPGLE